MPPDRLTEQGIAEIEPGATPAKHSDGAGLYLLVNPNGSRYWRFSYRFGGKRNTLSLGVHPKVSLEEARARRLVFRSLLASGVDPSGHVKAERAEMDRIQAAQDFAARFYLDNDGALSVRLGKRCFALSPKETGELRTFFVVTAGLACKEERDVAY